MELYIHYTSLPQDKELPDVVEELNEVLEEGGVVCGGEDGRIDLELEAICPLLIRLFHGCHRQVIFRHFPDDMKNPGFNTDSHPPHLSPHPFWCYHCYYWMSLSMALLSMALL